MIQENVLIVLVVAAVAIFIIGIVIGKLLGGGSRLKETSRKAEAAEKELADYKASVSEHFGQTADLIDDLTRSYKAVFEHLGSSARDLLSEEEVKHHLQSRANKAITLTYLADEGEREDTTVVEAMAEPQPEEKTTDEQEPGSEPGSEQTAADKNDDSEKQP